MTDVKSTETADVSLGQAWLRVARYYLGKRSVLLVLGTLVLIIGASLNWGWLVAAGIAPILLALLPCAIMCAFGLCAMKMMNSESKSTQAQSAAGTAEQPPAQSIANTSRPAIADSSCCQQPAAEPPPQVKQPQPLDERRDSHA